MLPFSPFSFCYVSTLPNRTSRVALGAVTRFVYLSLPVLHAVVSPNIQYLENASKPLESQAFFVKAACMCADISGFTALSEKHCKKGTAGLDTLVQARASVFINLAALL